MYWRLPQEHCNYVLHTDWQVGGVYGNQSETLTGLIFMA